MLSKSTARLLRVSIRHQQSPIVSSFTRYFSSTKETKAKNRVYTPVRRPDDFQSYLLLSTSSRSPLLTLWTASYCQTCATISPILSELIESGIGEEEGGVSYCEIEFDSQNVMESGMGMDYMITSLPTLLSFDRGEAQIVTKVTDPKVLKDREWLKEWIRTEARRRGSGGGGGGGGGGSFAGVLFGGLFGNSR